MGKEKKSKLKIKEIIKKVLTKEVILYIVFGVLTTLVNLGVFYILANILKLNNNISNILAIMTSVIVAYFTNKDMVFHSKANKFSAKIKEFLKFIAGRIVTMIIEWGGCAILFLLPIPQMLSKLLMTIIVIILNFFISKFFAFKGNI